MTQYEMGAWTRVGERLPEYGVQVIAWTGDGGYPVIACLRRDEHGDFWEGFHNGEEIDPACVTLWTPMPPPPPFEQNAGNHGAATVKAAIENGRYRGSRALLCSPAFGVDYVF